MDEIFEVCPRCRTATEDLHEDDGLCPQCEEEWTEICQEWAAPSVEDLTNEAELLSSEKASTRWSVYYRAYNEGKIVTNWPFGFYDTRRAARRAAAVMNKARRLEGKPEWAQYKVIDHGSHTWDLEWDDSDIT